MEAISQKIQKFSKLSPVLATTLPEPLPVLHLAAPKHFSIPTFAECIYTSFFQKNIMYPIKKTSKSPSEQLRIYAYAKNRSIVVLLRENGTTRFLITAPLF